MLAPVATAFQDLLEATSVARIFPPFEGTAVDMWAQGKFGITGMANTKPVKVRDGSGEADFRVGVGSVPECQQKTLCVNERRVSACEDLALGVVQLVHLNVIRWETYNGR